MNSQFMLAYIDPGSAAFVIVSILGFLSAVGYTFRRACQRLKERFFGNARPSPGEAEEAAPDGVSGDLDEEPPR